MKEHIGSYVHVPGTRISACCVGVKGHALFWWILSLRSKPCFRQLHEFGQMQSCFGVCMCLIFGEGSALNGIYYVYHMYMIHSIKPCIL
jgi:hypothetical protein